MYHIISDSNIRDIWLFYKNKYIFILTFMQSIINGLCIKAQPRSIFFGQKNLIKYGLNSARAGKVNKIRPTSYTVMDFEILQILKIKFETICNNKERHIEI